jgi:DNA-binding transcriptional LysR family regulator
LLPVEQFGLEAEVDSIVDLNDLRLFVEVVEHGNYSAAARALGVQTSKLSRRVRSLEEQLGVRLLNRTTRRISLTETGRHFHQHCLAVVAEARAAKEVVERTRASPHGIVRVSCPIGLLNSGVSQILTRFLLANPNVRILLNATNRRVDVIEEGIDFAIRVRWPPLEPSDLAIRKLGTSIAILVASPEMIAQHSLPTTLEELRDWPTIGIAKDSEKYSWTLVTHDGVQISHVHHPRLATDDLASLRMAAIQGLGVAQLPLEFVNADLDAGRLVRLLPALQSPTAIVHAIFPTRRGMVPAVRHLLDTLAAEFNNTVDN